MGQHTAERPAWWRRLGSATTDWLRRPGTRLGLHGVTAAALLAAAVYAALYVVPSNAWNPTTTTAPDAPPLTGDSPTEEATQAPGEPRPEQQDGGDADGEQEPEAAAEDYDHPQQAFAGWASQLTHLDIPVIAIQAYGYAEVYIAETQPGCNLTWTTLAGIGLIESGHGQTGGAELLDDGRSNPPIIGLPLDGGPERMTIYDTDNGELDGDPVYDRAVGAMQFIPTTWAEWGTDGTSDGVADPFNINDAAVSAGRYLCANGRDLTSPEDWWSAILSYNNLEEYAWDVFNAADDYGSRSQTGG